MRKPTVLALLLLCFCPLLQAQFIPNPQFAYFQTNPCPFDPSVTVDWPEGWQLYQTTDGHWDGPVDSTRCIQAAPANGNYGLLINLKQLDATRPLFARAQLDTLPFAPTVFPDNLYTVIINATLNPASVPLLSSLDCPDDLCSGALVGIAIPDEQGQPGAATRFQTGLLSLYSPNPNICYVNGESCFPTERFSGQYFREFILKFTFDSMAVLDNAVLQVSYADIYQTSEPGINVSYITQVPAINNPVNLAEVASPSFWSNFLGLYTAATYPSLQNLSYIEAGPVPNVTTPQNITLTVYDYQTLEMQPFAQFRGGLVAGSDSVRHNFTLLNDGGDLCFNFVDLIFGGGDSYQHGGGHIDINNTYSCMQFRSGSEIRVKEGATLHYGQDGAGMLVICAGGTIALERNATMIIDGILQISECNDALPPSQIYMDLPPGSKLIFTDKAWLTNRFSKGLQMQLNVRMLGGTLDDSGLDPASRSMIRRIYPEPGPSLTDNLKAGPNPFAGTLNLQYLAGADETLYLRWFDAQGRLVQKEKLDAQKGWNTWTPEAPVLPGFYFLEIQTAGGRLVRPLVALGE